MKLHYNQGLKQLSRKLRKESTLSEVLLWQQLKGRKMKGYQFTRQKPIGKYIVDFYCSKLNLVIEIDGSSHFDKAFEDKIRQVEIEKMSIKFLRFSDRDIKFNIENVLSYIEEWINSNKQPPNPLL